MTILCGLYISINTISESKRVLILRLLLQSSKLFFYDYTNIQTLSMTVNVNLAFKFFASWVDKKCLQALFSLFVNKAEQVFVCYQSFLF